MSGTARLLLVGGGVILAIWAVQQIIPGGPGAGLRVASDIPTADDMRESDKSDRLVRAKEFVGAGEFFNAKPFTVASLIGKKVILIDFWTYSCINCQRTQPYLNAWYEKYHDAGLEIIGVHTPEFEFEKVPANVRAAIAKANIVYPVVQDNAFGTWRAYQNQYWPRKYLIDVDGYIVYDHIGEGAYDETEERIREALSELAERVGHSAVPMPQSGGTDVVAAPAVRAKTPETYFGALRNERYLPNVQTGTTGIQRVTMPAQQKEHLTYLSGTWDFTGEYARCVADCRVKLRYEARQVNLVAESTVNATVGVLQDDKPLPAVPVSAATLYRLINDGSSATHTLELTVPAGVLLYTFTFG